MELRTDESWPTEPLLDDAFAWLCRRRRDYPADADVWTLRRRWPEERARLLADLVTGRYRFGLLSRVTLASGEQVDLWSARDAVVLKALTVVRARRLPVSKRCSHVNGHGGAKWAVREVHAHLADNGFVFRTDVKSYYASIDHDILLDALEAHVEDRRVVRETDYPRSRPVSRAR